jgi:hypothetical protein
MSVMSQTLADATTGAQPLPLPAQRSCAYGKAMRRTSLLAAVFAGALLPLVCVAPAVANPLDEAAAALRSSSVYVGAARPTIDRAALQGKLDAVKVAIVPTGGPSAQDVAGSIGERLDPRKTPLTVLVFEGTDAGVQSTAYCSAGSALREAVDAHRSELSSSQDVTATVADFAGRLRQLPRDTNGCDGGGGSSASSFGAQPKGSSHTGLIAFLIVLALVLLAAYLFVAARRRRRQRELSDFRAQVVPLYERLQYELRSLNPGTNAAARQALDDAQHRLASAGSQLAAADSEQKYGQARQTVLEGLYAARTARAALGLDAGPPLPPLTGGDVGHLRSPQQVNVQGQSYQGYPGYTPAAPYYFGGGYGIPGGWYGFPFWEGMLLGSVLSGGWGWGWGGGWGGYGAGYDNGYLTGFDAGEQAADDSGANDVGGNDTDAGGMDGTDGSGWGDSGGDVSWGDAGNSGAGDGGWGGDGGGGGDWGGDGGGGGGDWGSGGGDGGGW